MNFEGYLGAKQRLIEARLARLVKKAPWPARLRQAMEYSLLAGGKRLRPALVLMVDDVLQGRLGSRHGEDCWKAAMALECIHTYSLIHDDLPAMDDDVLRRGKPTCHVKFDEATAILAGDGLLTYAFELLAAAKSPRAAQAIAALASCAGPAGMVGGQQLDMHFETRKASRANLEEIHRMKTGALIRASVLLPVILDAAEGSRKALETYAQQIGLAFQIADDILDATATTAQLGKSAGADAKNHKTTYVTLLGLEKSKEEARRAVDRAIQVLGKLTGPTAMLEALARYFITRLS